MQGDVVDVFAAVQAFGDNQALILGPLKCSFAFCSFRVCDRLDEKTLNVFAQCAAVRWLKIVSVSREHFVKSVGGGENYFRDETGMLFRELRRENIFELVSQFAQRSKSARGRVALQRVNRAAHATKIFLIAGAFFECQAGLIHGLENFRRALEKEIAELGGALVVEKSHGAPSTR